MSGVSGRRAPAQRQASSVTRQASVGAGPGASRVRRSSEGTSESGGAWVVVEAEADIAAKGHPYISFDPAGSF